MIGLSYVLRAKGVKTEVFSVLGIMVPPYHTVHTIPYPKLEAILTTEKIVAEASEFGKCSVERNRYSASSDSAKSTGQLVKLQHRCLSSCFLFFFGPQENAHSTFRCPKEVEIQVQSNYVCRLCMGLSTNHALVKTFLLSCTRRSDAATS